jgi:hypothetical protein
LTIFLYYRVLLAKHNYNDQVKEDEMGRACSTNGEKRNAYSILVGKPEEKRPLERLRRWWVDNIKINLREIEWDGVDWIDLTQGFCEHGDEPSGSIKCWEVLILSSFLISRSQVILLS